MDEAVKRRLEAILADVEEVDREEYIKDILEKAKRDEEYANDEVLRGVNKKLLDEQVKGDKSQDDSILDTLQQTNDDFKRLRLIHTSKFNNDSFKNVNYLYLKLPNGKIEMIEISDENTLKNFINENKGKNYTAEDIFNYFKTHVSRFIEFKKLGEEHHYKAIKDDAETKNVELNKLMKYKEEHKLLDDIEVAVDSNGERLYRIGIVVIKFETKMGERQIKVIEDGIDRSTDLEKKVAAKQQRFEEETINHELSSEESEDTQDIDETEENEETSENTQEKPQQQANLEPKEQKIENNNDDITNSETTSDEMKNPAQNMTYDDFEVLVEEILVNEKQCDEISHLKIVNFVKKLQEVIEEKNSLDEDYSMEESYIEYYMKSVEPYYEAYKKGENTNYIMSEEEATMFEKYQQQLQQRREQNKNKVRVRQEESIDLSQVA